MKKSSLNSASELIIKYFDESKQSAYSVDDMSSVLSKNRTNWELAKTLRKDKFMDLLFENGMSEVKFQYYEREITRYNWKGRASSLEMISSVNPKGYFTHYSAMALHNLTEQIPSSIFFNIELSDRGEHPKGKLIQVAVDKAFSKPQRVTKNVNNIMDKRLFVLNGKCTGLLGVKPYGGIKYTDLTRTLLDAMVRPSYCGGVFEVISAFKYALDHEEFSANKLYSYLVKMNYTYPYHQSLGYYLQSSGYEGPLLDKLKNMPMEIDFYLDYDMKFPIYNEEWKLHVPSYF